MWMALQHSAPEDFIFATGELHSVQDVVEIAFATVGLDWREHVKRDEQLIRPTDSQALVGDSGKAKQVLGWQREYEFREMIREMTLSEWDALKNL
jgi:GDPmannose 4,6-dehydratase